MVVAFFGTPAFAVPTLERLLDSSHTVAAVITQPDRPRGRGQKVTAAPIKALAKARGVPVLQPDRLARDAFESAFTSLAADIGVIAAYGRILPEWLLQQPQLGMINVHASVLPKYRGAAPIHRAVIAGEASTGVTIMRVVKALDAGAMLSKLVTPIDPDETSADVGGRLARLGADLLIDTLNALADGPIPETPQDDALATYAARLTRDDGVVDWSRAARAIHDQVRGLHPWPHAFTFLDGSRVILHRTRVSGVGSTEFPGTLVRGGSTGLAVVCGDRRTLEIIELQTEGRRPMAASAFLAGHTLGDGQRFG